MSHFDGNNFIQAIYGLFAWLQLPNYLPVLDLPLQRATEEERIQIELDVAVVILTSSYVLIYTRNMGRYERERLC